MKIGIIGAGNIGGTLTRRLRAAVDAGGLDDSWRQQPGTPGYGADLDAAGVRRALAEAPRERPAEFRAPATA